MTCTHCGRTVQGTLHTPRSYALDYYLWLTGDTEPVVIKNLEGDGKDKVYQRLIRPRVVITCVDCWKKPEIRSTLPPSCPNPAGEAGTGADPRV